MAGSSLFSLILHSRSKRLNLDKHNPPCFICRQPHILQFVGVSFCKPSNKKQKSKASAMQCTNKMKKVQFPPTHKFHTISVSCIPVLPTRVFDCFARGSSVFQIVEETRRMLCPGLLPLFDERYYGKTKGKKTECRVFRTKTPPTPC